MWYRRITEYKDIEPDPVNIPTIPKNSKAVFGQHGFESVVFGPPKPRTGYSPSASKRKLGETDIEDTEDVAYFKRVRIISKKERIKHAPGPFAGHNVGTSESILDPKAKQEAEEREARAVFEKKAATLGLDHSETIESLNTLAWCLRNRRKFAEAEKLFRAAFTALKDTLILDDPDTLQVLARNLMTVLIDQNKRSETGEIWQITKGLFKSNLPEDRASVLIERLKLVYVFHVELEDDPMNQEGGVAMKRVWGIPSELPPLNDSITLMQMPSRRVHIPAITTAHIMSKPKEPKSEHRARQSWRPVILMQPLTPGSVQIDPDLPSSKSYFEQNPQRFKHYSDILGFDTLLKAEQKAAVKSQISKVEKEIGTQISKDDRGGLIFRWKFALDSFDRASIRCENRGLSDQQQQLRAERDAFIGYIYDTLEAVLGVDQARELWAYQTDLLWTASTDNQLCNHLGHELEIFRAITRIIGENIVNIVGNLDILERVDEKGTNKEVGRTA
jgi:hypothetical protein